MRTELDLDAIKRHAERYKWTENKDAFALIDEVERLRQQLNTAKRVGAAEELERMAATIESGLKDPYFTWMDLGPVSTAKQLKDRAAELRAAVKKGK